MTLDQAISLLRKQYEKAKKSPYVKNPLAWASYHTWKIVDKERRENNELLFNQKSTGKSY